MIGQDESALCIILKVRIVTLENLETYLNQTVVNFQKESFFLKVQIPLKNNHLAYMAA